MMIKKSVGFAFIVGLFAFQSLPAIAAESSPTITGAQKEGKLIIYFSS